MMRFHRRHNVALGGGISVFRMAELIAASTNHPTRTKDPARHVLMEIGATSRSIDPSCVAQRKR
jgi:hypothetical protein